MSEPTPTPSLEEIAEAVRARLTAKGDPAGDHAVRMLAEATAKLARAEAETDRLKAQVAAKADVPEGAKVLDKDQAAAYEALVAEHGTIEKAKEALRANAGAAERLARVEREQARRKAVDGVLNYDVLSKLAGTDALDFETEGDGDDRKTFVKYKDGGTEKREPAADYFAREFPEVKDVLFTSPTKPPGSGRSQRGALPTQPAQPSGGTNPVEAYIQTVNAQRTTHGLPGTKPATPPAATA